MDDRFKPQPIAGWYMIGAVASLLFMGLGFVLLAIHATADPAALPIDRRVLLEAEPQWVLAASAIGFIAGAIGALLLVLKRAVAVPALAVSLAGLFIWFLGILATPRFLDLLSTNEIAVALIVLALAWTIFWFARHSRRRGWLR